MKVFSATLVVLNGTKFSKHAVIAVGVTNDPPLPVFGQFRQIWVVSKFVCFVLYEILLDYKVFHVKADNQGNTNVSIKYDIDDIMHEYAIVHLTNSYLMSVKLFRFILHAVNTVNIDILEQNKFIHHYSQMHAFSFNGPN